MDTVYLQPPMTTWTRIQLDGEDGRSDDALKSAIMPVLAMSGHQQSAWGRVQSEPSTYILFSIWNNASAASAFPSSPPAQAVFADLRRLGTRDITITTADFGYPIDRATLRPHTQLRHVYFAAPVAGDARAAIARLPGLAYRHGFSISGQDRAAREAMAYYRAPVTGWVVDHGDGPATATRWDRRDCDELLAVMFWKDAERERRFLTEQKVSVTRPGDEPGTSIWVRDESLLEQWENQLREAGALGWRDEHVDFNILWPARPA